MLATMMLSGLGIATALNVPFQNFSKSCFSPWSTPAMASQCSGGEYREELGRFCAVVSMNPHTVGLCVGGCTRELSKFWNQRIVWGNAAPFLIFLFFLNVLTSFESPFLRFPHHFHDDVTATVTAGSFYLLARRPLSRFIPLSARASRLQINLRAWARDLNPFQHNIH